MIIARYALVAAGVVGFAAAASYAVFTAAAYVMLRGVFGVLSLAVAA